MIERKDLWDLIEELVRGELTYSQFATRYTDCYYYFEDEDELSIQEEEALYNLFLTTLNFANKDDNDFDYFNKTKKDIHDEIRKLLKKVSNPYSNEWSDNSEIISNQDAKILTDRVIDKMLLGTEKKYELLREQFERSDFTISEIDNLGFLAVFSLNDEMKSYQTERNPFKIDDVIADAPYTDKFAFKLLVEDGFLESLEISFLDIPQNIDVTSIDFSYDVNPRKKLLDYRIIQKNEGEYENLLSLKNEATGTIEEDVIDDSKRYEFDGFSFLKLGEIYECKILLRFFDLQKEGEPYKIIDREYIGDSEFYRIENQYGDSYYITNEDQKGRKIVFEKGEIINLDSGVHQKDLIAVNGLVHSGLRNTYEGEYFPETVENKVISLGSYRKLDVELLKKESYVVELDGDKIRRLKDFYACMEKGFKVPGSSKQEWSDYLNWMTDLSWIEEREISLIIYNNETFLPISSDEVEESFENIILPFWEFEAPKAIENGQTKKFEVYLIDDIDPEATPVKYTPIDTFWQRLGIRAAVSGILLFILLIISILMLGFSDAINSMFSIKLLIGFLAIFPIIVLGELQYELGKRQAKTYLAFIGPIAYILFRFNLAIRANALDEHFFASIVGAFLIAGICLGIYFRAKERAKKENE